MDEINKKNHQKEDEYVKALEEFLEKNGLKPDKIESLTPDASARRYFRLYFKDEKTKIAMVMGKVDPRIVYEEIMEKQVNFTEIPFVNIQRFLKKCRVRVPEIFMQDEKVLLLEDFGSLPLDVFVSEKGFGQAEKFYLDAVKQLVMMQNAEKDNNCYAFSLEFTKGMLMWEFNHFTEYFMGFLLKEDREMKREFERISEILSKSPYKFTHRDYHSKNLMCLDGWKVGILDFQDALMGPYVYDLVSLTCDAYVEMPENLEEKIKKEYIKKSGEKGFIIPSDFETHYAMCAVQRTLKAAGRFMFIWKEKKNKKFLPYVVPAVKKALKFMEKLNLKSAEKIKEKLWTQEKNIKDEIENFKQI